MGMNVITEKLRKSQLYFLYQPAFKTESSVKPGTFRTQTYFILFSMKKKYDLLDINKVDSCCMLA